MYISNVNLWNAEFISGNIKIYYITIITIIIIITIATTIIIINFDNNDSMYKPNSCGLYTTKITA